MMTSALDPLLATLELAQLVHLVRENEYLFKHALIQDTAYQSLLKNERKRLHGAIGNTLEKTHAERAGEFASELAHHFGEAGADEKSCIYAQEAGDNASRVFAYPEAQGYYQRALNALTRLPETDVWRRARVDVIVKLIAVSLRTQGPDWCLEYLQTAEDILRALGNDAQDRERLARVHFWMGDAYSHLNQQREAIGYLQQVLEVVQQGVSDESLLAIPANVIGRALVAQGKFQQAEPLLARAVPLLEKSANWYEWVLAVGFLGFARGAQGDIEGGLFQTTRAFDRAHELGTPTGIADSHIFAAFICHQKSDYSAMREHADAALEAARRLNDHLVIFLAHNVQGWACTRLGYLDAAGANFRQAQELAAEMGGQLFFADMFQAAFAELALKQGNMELARARAETAVETARQVGSVFSEGLAQRVWAQTLPPEQGAEHFEASIQLFQAGNARIEVARTRAAWTEILAPPHSAG